MFIFKFISLLFIALFLFILIFAFRILTFFRKGMNQFNNQNGNKEGQHRKNSSYSDDEKVIDTRNPEDAKKKIFTKDEGEYVDYTEEEKQNIFNIKNAENILFSAFFIYAFL